MHGGVLVFPCIKKDHSADYSCEAETDNGPVRSNSVALEVGDATPNVTDIRNMCNTGNNIIHFSTST